MLQLLLYNTAGTLVANLDDRPDAGATFSILNPQGGATLSGASATIDSVNTTLSSPAAAGASALAVTSATGITVGRKYLLGGPELTGGERVTVKAVSGTTVSLVRPLRLSRASGDAFVSTRVSMAVTAAAIGVISRHYRAEITWAVSSAAQPTWEVPFDVVRYAPTSGLSFDDVVDGDPLFAKRLAAGFWWPAVRDEAWSAIVDRVAQKVDPGAIIGAIDLARAHKYMCRVLVAETGGKDWDDYRKIMAQRFEEELQACLGQTAIDTNQDGNVTSNEGWRRSVILERG